MADPRLRQYAELLVNRCVAVQPGWQVIVQSSPLARPLVEEVVRAIALAGGHAITQLSYGSLGRIWLENAPEERLSEVPSLAAYLMDHADAIIGIEAPENRQEFAGVDPARLVKQAKAWEPHQERMMKLEVPWVGCQYPTAALAQDAGMSTDQFAEFIYGCCLLDWDAEGRKMARIKERFDRAREVRIVAEGTDIRLSLQGREGHIDDGHLNMPGGEVFYAPHHEATEGVVTFSYASLYNGQRVDGVRLVFRGGKVVEATAKEGQAALIQTLDTDAGARFLGELGIGCNPGITRGMRNTLYDEKINGTIHLAVGAAYPFTGGTNQSAVHWDLVCDLRQGGRIECDGEVVQESGVWQI